MRVMTYNIRGGWGMDGQWSTERIAEVVLEQDPDILCLQEVHQRLPQSRFVDQPGRLQKALGLPVVFQANLRLGVGAYGLALVSRYPVNLVQNHLLPSAREQRGALEVNLTTPMGLLTVFCTHWGLNGAERERQGAHLAKLVADAVGPVLVCGDFNEGPKAAGISALRARADLADADADLNRLTYPADTPAARIDYVLYSPELMLRAITPINSQASDHLPLVADF